MWHTRSGFTRSIVELLEELLSCYRLECVFKGYEADIVNTDSILHILEGT